MRYYTKLCKILILLSFFIIFFADIAYCNEILKIGTYPNNPIIFENAEGKIDGFFIDIINHIASKEGWKLEYIHNTWEKNLELLKNKELDLLLGIAYTEKRDLYYDYPEEGIILTWGQIFTSKENEIQSILDLHNKDIGVLKNDIYYIGDVGLKILADKFKINTNFIGFDNYNVILEKIENKEINAGLIPRLYGISRSQEYNVKKCPVVINPIELTAATPENHKPYLLKALDRHLKELKNDESSYYYQRLEYWTSRYEKPEMPFILKVALILVYITFLLFIFIFFIIRKQVLVKTKKLRKNEKLLEKNKQKITELHQVALKMEKANSSSEIYNLIVETAKKILDLDLCTFSINENKELKTVAINSNSSSIRIDTPGASNIKKINQEYKSKYSFPVENIGVLQIYSNKNKFNFNDEEQKLIHLLLSHTISALQRLRAEEKIKYISFHDRLTEIYNREYLDEQLNRLDSSRQLPLSVIMGDLNGLKLINDAFGHHKGDELLKLVAAILKDVTRQEDIIGRWGGDEFLIILPKTSEAKCQRIIARIKENFKNKEWEVPISIALGTASKTNTHQDIDEVIKEADDRMYNNKMKQGQEVKASMIKSLIINLKNKKYDTHKHCEEVTKLSHKFGKKLNLDNEKIKELILSSSLHDIGLLCIPDKILRKKSELNNDEWEKAKTHPEIGYRIARASDKYTHIAENILYHHENWDGSGYPSGLKNTEIPLFSRIIRIVDAYNSMVNKEIYREKLSPAKAIEELKKNAGTEFDPELVNIFINQVYPELKC